MSRPCVYWMGATVSAILTADRSVASSRSCAPTSPSTMHDWTGWSQVGKSETFEILPIAVTP